MAKKKIQRLTLPLPLRPGKFDADQDQRASNDLWLPFFSPFRSMKFPKLLASLIFEQEKSTRLRRNAS